VGRIVFRDLSRGFLLADLRTEIDAQLDGGLARLRERLGGNHDADADVHFQEVVEGDRHGLGAPASRACSRAFTVDHSSRMTLYQAVSRSFPSGRTICERWIPSNFAPKRSIALQERELRASAFSSMRLRPSVSKPWRIRRNLQDGFTAP